MVQVPRGGNGGPAAVEAQLKYGASATEQEIVRGALAVPDPGEHVLCWVRERDGVPVDESARDYLDPDQTGRPDAVAKRRLADLKRRLQEHLPGNVIPRRTLWNGGELPADYLRDFGETVYQRLAALVEVQARLGRQRDAVEEEAEAHERFAAERRRVFFGQAEALAAIIAYGSLPAIAAAAAFGVVGAMGSGKSALIAKAAEQLRLAQPQACYLQRDIGATPASSNGRSLLESLCQQTAGAYGDDSAVPGEWRELAQALPKWLGLANAERPLIVLLDALDQLSEADNASDLYWLPARLPPHVRLVCSAVSAGC